MMTTTTSNKETTTMKDTPTIPTLPLAKAVEVALEASEDWPECLNAQAWRRLANANPEEGFDPWHICDALDDAMASDDDQRIKAALTFATMELARVTDEQTTKELEAMVAEGTEALHHLLQLPA